uniref:RING-type domain-containing protein n=1 Tax=Mola mola TaxID=94237 RepID=A0A3Q4B3V5_MOLML
VCVYCAGMFASCCNWMCVDSADEDPAETEHRHQSYTNSAFSSQPSPPPPEHTCQACRGRFDTPHVCVDCRKNYCSRCSAQLEPRPRLCHTCQRFYGNLLVRAELMKLKVKELRDYLHLHEISTHLCREKEELVELVLCQQSSPSGSSAPETPIADPSAVTPDLNPRIPPITPEPPTPTQNPEVHAAEPEALTSPAENTTMEHDTLDSDDVSVSGRRASLSDLSCLDDIEALSVRQLKEILARNFVNYTGCCEKWELMERVRRLYQEQQRLLGEFFCEECGADSGSAAAEENLCKVCMDCPIDCVLLECGHMITCTKCGKRMNECPICRQYVVRAVHVFRS